jgi:excisionase family DNA binding protein
MYARKRTLNTPPVRLVLNVPEAAEAIGVGIRTLQKLIYSGKLPAVREGRSVRVRVADLEAYLEAKVSSNVA